MGQKKNSSTSNSIGAVVVWLVLLSALAVFFNYLLGNIYNPNQKVISYVTETGQKEVILIRNRSGHYVANGKINDQSVTFLLDTGATHVSVPQAVAQRLGLKEGRPINAQTANGIITTYTTLLDSISIGNIVMHNVKGGINPFMKGDNILLGMGFLKHLELTQRNDTLKISIP